MFRCSQLFYQSSLAFYFPIKSYFHLNEETYVMLCVIRYRSYNLKNVKNTDGGGLLLVKLDSIFLVVLICFIVPIAKSYLVVTDLFYVKISEPIEVNSEINFLFKKTLYVFYFDCLAFYVLTYINSNILIYV